MLVRLAEKYPGVMNQVLDCLDPLDLAMLARTGSALWTFVNESGLEFVGGDSRGVKVYDVTLFYRRSLSMLRWAVENGCGSDSTISVGTRWQGCGLSLAAADKGDLETLRYWHQELGRAWHPMSSGTLARGNHFSVLKWAVTEAGCPLKPGALKGAVECCNLDMANWALSMGCTWKGSGIDGYLSALHTLSDEEENIHVVLNVFNWLWDNIQRRDWFLQHHEELQGMYERHDVFRKHPEARLWMKERVKIVQDEEELRLNENLRELVEEARDSGGEADEEVGEVAAVVLGGAAGAGEGRAAVCGGGRKRNRNRNRNRNR